MFPTPNAGYNKGELCATQGDILPAQRRIILPVLILFAAFAGLLLLTYEPPANKATRLGHAALTRGHYQTAVEQFTRVINLQPDDAKGYFARSEAYRLQDNLDSAAADYEQAVTLAPEDTPPVNPFVDLFEQRGRDAWNARDYQQTVSDFTYVLKYQQDSYSYTYRGIAYGQLAEYEKALPDLNLAIELAAGKGVQNIYYSNRGQTYNLLRRYDEALVDLNRAIEAENRYAAGYTIRGDTYQALGQYDLALDDYNRSLDLKPSLISNYNYRGMTYLAMGRIDLAQADFNQALAQAEQEVVAPLAYAGLGKIALAQGDDEGAGLQFNRALELAKTNIPDHLAARSAAYLGLGQIALNTNDHAGAIGYYDQALALPIPDPLAYLGRASAYAKMDDAQAVTDYAAWVDNIGREILDIDSQESRVPSYLEMAHGRVYRIPFTAGAGQTISIHANADEGVLVDPLVLIVDADGIPLAADDDSGGHYDSAILDFPLPASGDYTLVVTHAGCGTQGGFEVTLDITG
jgi:tetratricopeptide (TPR) repeat protein